MAVQHLERDGRLGLEVLVFSLLAMAVPLTYWIGGKWVKSIRLNNAQLAGRTAGSRGASRDRGRDKKKRASGRTTTNHGRTSSSTSTTRLAARKRYLVFLTLAWVVWGSSFLSAVFVMGRYLSRLSQKDSSLLDTGGGERPLVLVHLGATFICSLFAEVFMISAFLTSVHPDIREQESAAIASSANEGEEAEEEKEGGGCSTRGKRFPRSRFSITTPYSIVILLGLSMSLLGGVLVSLIEFLPDQNSKLVYTCLSGLSILIGVTKTHGLGGWIRHNNNSNNQKEAKLNSTGRSLMGSHQKKNGGGGESLTTHAEVEYESSNFDSDWSFWQPGRGGNAFIATQVFGWCFFAMSLLGLGWISKYALFQIASCGVFCLRIVTLPTAAVMIIAQLILAGSLTVFQVKENRENVGKGKLGEELRTKEGSNQSKTKQQQQQRRPTFYSFASARERYSSLRKGFEDWWLVVLFYCPHYLTLCAVLIPYLCLPILYASSIMMGVYLPLHLWGLIGQPQQTGLRESKTFLEWSGTTFEKICSRFLGGVTCICDYDCCEGEKNSSGRRIADVGDGNKYIFAYHPHALYPLGLVFYHRLAEFRRHFGQIRPIPLVASVIFRLPILGQLACRAGVREVTGSVFRKALRDRGAVTLVPGGQAELCVAPRAHSDKDPEIVLNTRHKGFIKIALQTGAHLVPVFCFGEIYQLKNGLCFPRLQAWTYKQFGFPVPFLPVGRFGIPFPLNSRQTGHPFTFVVGRPMKVDQVMPEGRPVTQEEIDQTHAKYFSRVEKLFHKYKKQCGYQDKALVLEDK